VYGLSPASYAFTDRYAGLLDQHLGSTCTAAVLWIEHHGEPVIQAARGRASAALGAPAIGVDTPFDLASLTKLFTATAALRLIDGGVLGLQTSVQSLVPAFRGTAKERITVAQLLTHTSGLPPFRRVYGPWATDGDPMEAILSCPLSARPGSRVKYSDVGFITLGRIVEVASGLDLHEAICNLVLAPLDIVEGVGFGSCAGAPATEYDPWRGMRVRGVVHDENAAVLGGVAGHAGLFGRANAVAALAGAYLHPDGGFLSPPLARAAISPQTASHDERRGFGFALRSPDPSASEYALSASAFGHYGFTGTSIWSDPQRDVVVVLLTNRVYFGRAGHGIKVLRTAVHQLAAEDFPTTEL
jgi:serine-type D-Ala-D-Ala carboxypeptidase